MGNHLFSSQLPREEIIEKTKFSRQNRSVAYSPSYKEANVESNEKNENCDTKYITLTAVVDPNCAIDILSMCIIWLDIIKVKIPESFFFFLLLVAKKQKILLVFSDEPRGEKKGDWKKAKKIYTVHSHHLILQLCHRRVAPTYSRKFPSLFMKTFFLLLLVLPKAPPHNNYSIGQNKLSLKWNACLEWKRRWKRPRWRKRPAR